jgi:ABC-type Co2+ transport system permease subunit
MHMADALLSPAVGLGMWALSTGSIAVSTAKIKHQELTEKGSMSIVGVTQNGNTGWSGVKLLHFPLNDGTCEEYDCGSDENYDNRRHCV